MRSSPLVSKTALGALLPLVPQVAGQWAAGGSYFAGSGAPAAAPYQLVDDYIPSSFFDKFTFYDQYDPTYGHVKYVNRSIATTNGYAYYSATNNSAVIKPDTTNKWPPGYLGNNQYFPGRPSVRLESFNTYYHGLFIFDASHIPTGCGTWPAYWLLGPSWPANGEIDIIEGVHTSTYNTMALHTSSNCSIIGSGQTGTFTSSNCDHSLNGNSGCGSELRNATANPNNYGPDFNANRGGVYATEWTSEYIKHWWFPRGQIPASIAQGRPDVSSFGTPAVNAQGPCDIDSHFRNMSIVINIDFCGAWAGSVYDQWDSCPQDVPKSTEDTPNNRCAAYVGEYPERFTNAYWEINRVQVYQMPANVATTSVYSTSLSSVAPVGQSTNTIPLGMGATTTTLPSAPPYTGPVSSATSSGPVSVATGASCPAYNNQVVSDAAGYQYTLLCGQEYNAASAHVLDAASFDACLVLCDGWPGCLAVTFAPANQATAPNGRGACYSKESATGYLTSNSNVNSARRVGGPAQSGAIVNTSNRPTSNAAASSSAGSPPPGYTADSPLSAASSDPPSLTSSAGGVAATTAVGRANFACPANDQQIVQDNCGVKYILGCDRDALAAGSSVNFFANSFNLCFEACSSGRNGTCTGFVWFANFCYLKAPTSATDDFRSEVSEDRIAAINIDYYRAPGGSLPPNTIRSCTLPYTTTTTRTTTATSIALSPSSVVRTASSTWVSAGTTYTSAWPVTTTSSVEPPAYSSLVTFVSTTYATWALEGVTDSSAFPVTVATTATLDGPSELLSDSITYSSTFPVTTVSEVAASSGPPSYPSPEPDTTIASTTVSEYSSDGVTYSSPFAVTSVSSGSPVESSVETPPVYTQSSTTVSEFTSEGVTYSSTSAVTSVSSAAVSSPAASTPACPATYEGACGAPASSTNPYCSSSRGNTFAVQCGVGYYGTTIPDNEVNITIVSDSYKRDVLPGFAKRVSVPSYASCQATCENTASCVAFQFVPADNCTLFSQVTGTYNQAGAVGAAAVPDTATPPSYVVPASSATPPATTTSSTASLPPGYIGASSTSSSAAGPPPIYGGGASVTTTVSGTQTYTLGSTVTTSVPTDSSVPAVTTTIFSTLPSGGSFTTSGTSSFYVVSSSTTGGTGGECASSVCFTCGITPIVTGGCDVSTPPTSLPSLPPLVTTNPASITGTVPTTASRPWTRSVSNVLTTRVAGTCPRVISGTGYTTIFTTYTMTTCLPGEVCANPGYVIIGNSTSVPGQVIVTTTNSQGSSVAYTVVPTKPPSSTDLPGCAQPCIIDYSPCSPSDVNCICKNQPFLSTVTDCIAARCSGRDIQACIDYATKLCSDNGVPSLPTAGLSYTGTGVATRTSSRPVPSISELPSCAQGCVADFRPCAATDLQCICTNQPYLTTIRNCIANGCSDASIQDVIVFANNLCRGYGVTALPTAGISHTGTLTQTTVVTRTTVTAVPSVTDLPECAQGCVIDYGNCDPLDVRCICENKPYLESITECVTRGCNQTTIRDIFEFADSLCGGYGVEITTVISYVPTTVYQPTTILSTYVTTAPGGTLVIGTSTAVVTSVAVFPTYGGGTGPGTGPGTGLGTGVATVTTGPTVTVTGSPSNLPRCPYNNGQSYVDSNGQVYIITCDTSFTDAVLETSTQRNFLDCMSRCDAYNTLLTNNAQQCGGISFISTQDSNNCLLQVGDEIGYSPGVWSGRLISRAATRPTTIGSGPGTGPAPTSYLVSTAVQGTGPGTGPAPTQYISGSTVYGTSTAVSTVVSNGITYTSVYGVTTVVSVSVNTVTTTTVQVSVSVQPTTIQNTITGGTATVTQAVPTITASPTAPGYIVTVTEGGGGGVVTSIVYVQPSSTSSSSTCRLTPTNYLKGQVPTKRDANKFELGDLKPVPAARPAARPAFR